MRFRFCLAVLGILSLGIGLSCQGVTDPFHATTGALKISLASNDRSIVAPDVDLRVTAFRILGAGPDGAAFDLTTGDDSVVQKGLVPGAWTITAQGLNRAGEAVVADTAEITVLLGRTLPLSLVCVPLAGTGGLALSVAWDEAPIVEGVLSWSLTDTAGQPAALVNSGEGAHQALESSDLAAGYYTLVLKVSEAGIERPPVWTKVATVRILAGHTTEGAWNLVDEDLSPVFEGDLEVGVSADDQGPWTVDLTEAEGLVSASTDAPAPDYVWFLDGDFLLQGPSSLDLGTDLPAGLEAGPHTLTAVVNCQGRLGAADYSWTLEVPGGDL